MDVKDITPEWWDAWCVALDAIPSDVDFDFVDEGK